MDLGEQDRILAQETTSIKTNDDAETLRARIVSDCLGKALPAAICKLASDDVSMKRKPSKTSKRNASQGSLTGSSVPSDSKAGLVKKSASAHGVQTVKSAVSLPVCSGAQQPMRGDAARYAARGVSSDKGDVHSALKDSDKGLFPTAFCKLVPDYITGDPTQAIVMHADGAGTKSSLAYMYWHKTGDLSVWKGIAQDALVMNLDDLLCVGVTDNIALSSTIGRNKNLITGEVLSAIISGTEELIQELQAQGVGIISTEELIQELQ